MTDTPVRPDSEQLRAFEELMQQQGAAAFAAGIAPWESWDDANNDLQWQRPGGTGHHPHLTHARKSAPARAPGQRLLVGVTRLMVLVLLVGIGGVYFSSRPIEQQMVQGIQPPPIVLHDTRLATLGAREPAPDRVAGGLPDFDAYPAPAAGPAERPAIEVVAKQPATPAEGDDNLASTAPNTKEQVDSDSTASPWQPAALEFDALPPVAEQVTAPAWEPFNAGSTGNPWQPAALESDASPPVAEQVAAPASEPPNAGSTGNPWQPAAQSAGAWQPMAAAPAEEPAQYPAPTVVPDTPPADNTPPPPPADLAWQSAQAPHSASKQTTDRVADTVQASGPGAPAAQQTHEEKRATEAPPPASGDQQQTAASGTTIASSIPATETATPSPRAAAVTAAQAGEPVKATQWVVNLAAYNSEKMASRMMEKFRAQGVETELFHITVNGKDMVRLRTTGLDSYQEAQDWSEMLEDRLALSGTWVSKR